MAFNLSAELVYTNVVNLIDLAGVPLHAEDRGAMTLVLAGGHCAFNPEPLADFVDAFVLGDGEEVVGEINEVMAGWLAEPAGARESRELPAGAGRRSRGVRAGLYESTYATAAWWPRCPAKPRVPAEVAKRTVTDLADWPYPATSWCR
jgi:radical SAM superfamily enzyme YgiQ (UPF0313 family)